MSDMMICLRCKDYGRPAKKKRGSNGMALLAWAVFPIGAPYTLWRIASKMKVCKHCDSTELVDIASATGQRLMALIIGEVDEAGNPLVHTPSAAAIAPVVAQAKEIAKREPPPTQPDLSDGAKKRTTRPDEW